MHMHMHRYLGLFADYVLALDGAVAGGLEYTDHAAPPYGGKGMASL
jgi:hypothetical protein